MAIQMAPKPSKLDAQRALLAGRAPRPAPNGVIAAVGKLPAMIKDAAKKLATAATAAEILDVIDATGLAYDASKRAGRIAKAKGAHDTVVAAAHRAQADALEIEAAAKRRLADEYDGAQERGEVQKAGRAKTNVPDQNISPAKVEDIGLTRKDVHEARRVRNAEKAQPGVVKAALDNAIAQGVEPSRAVINEAVATALGEKKEITPATAEKQPVEDVSEAENATEEINPFDDIVARWCALSIEDREAFVAYLRVSGAIPEPVGAAVSAGNDLREPAAAASGQIVREGDAPRETDRQAGEKSQGGGDASIPDTEFADPAIALLPDAAGQTGEGVTPPASSPVETFTNPRCQQPDTCHFVHTRDDCFDCSLAWSKRPKDEQRRLWAEANAAAEREAA
ncbi:MAG: hypothetical protein PS018_18710 [bacterium]|nr:hypothetical protein [bacterium]